MLTQPTPSDRTGVLQSAWFFSRQLIPITLVCTALGILLSSGWVHGLWTQRWNPSPELANAVVQLDQVPHTIGEWQGVTNELDPEVVALSRLAGCWMRTYTHAQKGTSITVLLMCGRPGPASVHTPEWCYGGAGYEMAADPVRFTLPLTDHAASPQFWTARFLKQAAVRPTELRIFWGWNAGAGWQAPDFPRLVFGSYPALFKLYLVRRVTHATETLEHDPTVEFMQTLLPVLNQTLFPPPR